MLKSVTRIVKAAMLAAVGLAVLGGASAQAQNQRRRRDLPGSAVPEVVPGIPKAQRRSVNYQAIGSGGGIKNITAHAVDFGASDAPMNAAELAAAPGILHIPTVAGAVVVAYNVPGVGPGIHLTPAVSSPTFSWARSPNGTTRPLPGLTPVPSSPVRASFRSTARTAPGHTNIFTTYLSEVSGEWARQCRCGQVGPLAERSGRQRKPGRRAAHQAERGRYRVY